MLTLVPQEPEEGHALGFVTIGNPSSMRSWSSMPYFMAQALESHFPGLKRVGPLRAPWVNRFRAYARGMRLIRGRNYSAVHARPVSNRLVAHAARDIREAGLNAVFAPAGSALARGIPSDVVLIYSSDAIARLINGYHPHNRVISEQKRIDTEELEQEVIARADLLLYPTEWVARSAIEDLGADPSMIHISPWGADIEPPPPAPTIDETPSDGRCRLLLVGVDWTEKEADIAVETLRSDNLSAELTICGCTPPTDENVPRLTVIPFLDKSDPDQRACLQGLYREADFFLLPTRADCYGIVFCEASAYGVPSIGTATSGVPGVVAAGENGHLLPHSAGGSEYAALIAEISRDEARHRHLKRESRRVFRLNWDVWYARAAALISDLLATRHPELKERPR